MTDDDTIRYSFDNPERRAKFAASHRQGNARSAKEQGDKEADRWREVKSSGSGRDSGLRHISHFTIGPPKLGSIQFIFDDEQLAAAYPIPLHVPSPGIIIRRRRHLGDLAEPSGRLCTCDIRFGLIATRDRNEVPDGGDAH